MTFHYLPVVEANKAIIEQLFQLSSRYAAASRELQILLFHRIEALIVALKKRSVGHGALSLAAQTQSCPREPAHGHRLHFHNYHRINLKLRNYILHSNTLPCFWKLGMAIAGRLLMCFYFMCLIFGCEYAIINFTCFAWLKLLIPTNNVSVVAGPSF